MPTKSKLNAILGEQITEKRQPIRGFDSVTSAGRVIGVTRERVRQLLVKGSHLGLFEYKPFEYPFVAKETLIADYRKHLSLGRVAKANGITSGYLGKLLNGIPCNSGCAVSDGLFVLTEKEKSVMDNAQVDTFGLRINQDVCFTTHNNKLHMGTTKRQLKILRDVAPLLRQVLKPDEEILLAVRAASPMSWFEQLTTGWIIYLLKRCVLVFTNKRILHLPTTMNFKPKSSVAQVVYGDLTEAKVSGFMGRVLTLTYKTGKKESFNYVESPEFKKLKALLSTLPKGGQPSEVSERHHLCPRCQARLVKAKFTCPSCQLQFKDGERAIRLSVLYPGGGYFYTGHPVLGLGDAVTEGLLLILFVGALIDVLTGEKGSEGWALVAIFGAALFIEKAQTIYHTKHYVSEYIPVDKKFLPLTAPA